jgi:hypothetical protein
MNLLEVVAILAILFGLASGFWASIDVGVWAAIVGALRGAAIAYGWFFASMMAMCTLLWLGLLYRPTFPRCTNGCCRDLDYTYLYLDSEATGHHKRLQDSTEGKLVRCGCGTIYLDSLRDRRFYAVLDDGSMVPYMRYSPFGRWQPDTRPSEAPG